MGLFFGIFFGILLAYYSLIAVMIGWDWPWRLIQQIMNDYEHTD